MAHPKRKKFVEEYLHKLLPDAVVVWDEKNDVWDTRRRCLEQHLESGKKWCLTIQDDCLIADDFLKKAVSFISLHNRPKRRSFSFQFYFWATGNGYVIPAMRRGFHRGTGMKSGLAICLNREVIGGLLEYWKDSPRLLRHDDSRIGEFLRKRRIFTMYPAPSLVQHRDSESLIYTKGEMPDARKARVVDSSLTGL